MSIELSTLGAVIKAAYEGQLDTNALTDVLRQMILDSMPKSARGVALGVAELDAAGLVPLNRLNVAGLTFQGAWNPTTNTPALLDGTGTVGQFYKASTSGTFNFGNGNYTFVAGDWVIYAGGTWQRIATQDAVAMVNGQVGSVVLTAEDVGALPNTYTPPAAKVQSVNGQEGAVVLDAAAVGALPADYVPPIPRLSYANRLSQRVASTWYTNVSAYDRIVNISTNYVESSASSLIAMRAPGTTVEFAVRAQAIGTGFSNQVMQAHVPAGWQYRFVPGASRTISTWFEGDYA